MENVDQTDSQRRYNMNKKLRSPQFGENNTMDSFQDGGQTNMNREQNDYGNAMESSHGNSELSTYPPSSREQMMGPDGYSRMNPGMHPGQMLMQGYSYNRESYPPDQHGGMQMTGSGDFPQNSPFSGHYMQPNVRHGFVGSGKGGMGPMRPGIVPSGGPGMSGGYQQQSRPIGPSSGQNISQQSGPTPTLNQLLQNSNTPQSKMDSNSYSGDYPKQGLDAGNGPHGYGSMQNWSGIPRPGVGSYNQVPMPGTPFRGQTVNDMNQPRQGYSSPNYHNIQQNQYGGQHSPNSRYGMMSGSGRHSSGQSFPGQSVPYGHHQYGRGHSDTNHLPGPGFGGSSQPASSYVQSPPPTNSSSNHQHAQHHLPHSQQQQPSQMSSGQPPGATPGSRPSPSPSDSSIHSQPQQLSPTPSQSSLSRQQHQPNSSSGAPSPKPQQQQHSSGQVANQPSPSGSNSSWSGNSTSKKSEDEDICMEQQGNCDDDNSQGVSNSSTQHPSVSALRPPSSPAGSTGSRSNTPASVTGSNQAGSPMPPRPPSESQNTRMTQSPMATQGYNQQMMPPPMGPNQMGYGPGGGKMGGGMSGNLMGPHYQQYNSQYPQQGGYPGRHGSMHSNSGPMPNMPSHPNNMYNGPSHGQMPPHPMFNSNMPMNSRGSGYPYGQNSMNNQFGGYNQMGPGSGPPGTGPGPGPGMNNSGQAPGSTQSSSMTNSTQGPQVPSSQGQPSGPNTPGVKGAQAAAQAALIAAANSAKPNTQPVRPSMPTPQKYGPQGQMNHVGYGPNMPPGSMGPNVPNSLSPVPNSMSSGPHTNSMPNDMSMSNSVPNSSYPGSIDNNSSNTHQSSYQPSPRIALQENVPPPSHSDTRGASTSVDSRNSSMPSSSVHPSHPHMQQHDSNSSSSSLSSASTAPHNEVTSGVNSAHDNIPVDEQGKYVDRRTGNTECNKNNSMESDSVNMSQSDGSDVKSKSQMTYSNSNSKDMPSHVGMNQMPMNQDGMSSSAKQEMPITTTATHINADIKTSVTQSITSPVTSISETGNMNDSHMESIPHPMLQPQMTPQQQQAPPTGMHPMTPHMPPMEESSTPQPPEKKKKEGALSYPPTPANMSALSPGSASVSSFHDDLDYVASPATTTTLVVSPAPPAWATPGEPVQKAAGGDVSKLYEMGNEPERRYFLDRLMMFLEEKAQPLTAMPSISKQPLDLYKLFGIVQDKGGMLEVTKGKKWKEICGMVNIGTSASAAFTLKKNYIKYLFAYECQFVRGGIDPQPILAQMEAQLQQKREQKHRRAPSPGSQSSQDAFRPPSAPNNNQQMDGYPSQGMSHGGYMQNSEHMGPMGSGMMGPGGMMGNMMPPNSIGGNAGMQPHMNNMQGPGGMMPGNMPPGGMMGNNYNMMQGMHGHGPNSGHGPGMMPNMQNNMMGHMSGGMGMPGPGMHNSGMPGNMSGGPMMGHGPMHSQSGMPNQGGMPSSGGIMSSSSSMQAGMAISGGRSLPPGTMAPGGMPNSSMPPNGMPPSSMGPSGPAGMPNNIPPNNSGSMPPSSTAPVSSGMSANVNNNSNDSVACLDPFSDEPRNGPFPRHPSSNSPMPPNFSAGMPPQQPVNTVYSNTGNFNRPNISGLPSNVGNYDPSNRGSATPNRMEHPGMSDSPSAKNMPSSTPPASCVSPGPTSLASSSSTTSTASAPSMSQRQFPFGDQFTKPERFGSPSSVRSSSPLPPSSSSQPVSSATPASMSQSYPLPAQSMPPSTGPYSQQSSGTYTSQSGPQYSGPMSAGPNAPTSQMDPVYQNRYAGQHSGPVPPYPGPGPQGQMDPYGQPPNYSNMPPQGGYQGNKAMEQQYPGYMHGQQGQFPGQNQGPPGQYPGQHGQFPSRQMSGNLGSMGNMPPSSMYNTPNKRYDNYMGPVSQNIPLGYGDGQGHYPHNSGDPGMAPYDSHLSSDGRQYSPMPRYSSQGGYPGGPSPSMSPGGPYMPGYRSNQRMSPHREGWDKMGYSSPPKSAQKSMPGHFPTKKDMIFPPDSIEAVSPVYTKRKKLNKNDVGQIEAWRLMMALKSGLLAESTWALDTLNILLYDDSTVSYFSLCNLPGLVDVLLDHFRRCLIEIFGNEFEQLEKPQPNLNNIIHLDLSNSSFGSHDEENSSFNLSRHLDTCPADSKDGLESTVNEGDKLQDFTFVSRNGLVVKIEETNEIGPGDPKTWDVFCNESYDPTHWMLGLAGSTEHIIPYFDSDQENHVYKKLFHRPLMEYKDDIREENETRSCVCQEMPDLVPEDGFVQENPDQDSVIDKLKCEDIKEEVLNCNCDIKKTPHKINNILPETKKENNNSSDFGSADIQNCTNVHVKEEPPEIVNSSPMGMTANDPKAENDGSKQESIESANHDSVETDAKDTFKTITDNCDSEGKDLVPTGCKRSHDEVELEDESYQRDEPPLFTVTDARDNLGRRCVCISNIFRSLSCIPTNYRELSKHAGFLFTLGKLLMLHHRHLPRNTTRKKFDRDESELEDLMDNSQSEEEWWWGYLTQLRENSLVILANISGHLHLMGFPEEICRPILDGLLHWVVCPSSVATDPLPSSVLSPQRLVLETLCKLCIHDDNVDLLLATPPFDRIVQLFNILVKLLSNRSEQVTMEFAIVLLSELSQGDCSAVRAIALQHPVISLLLDFLECAEQKAMQVLSTHGQGILRDNPEMMGTSLDMLRRAANILLQISGVPENRPLFVHHQQRLLYLVMSQVLDQVVARILSDVMYQCFQDGSS